ncbi:MAG: UPF0175 family protein [Candidatus Hydrogenedentes bacterium]|nr:UPF0175 family protein [Candidatus Hydrogenedentota bacterium]
MQVRIELDFPPEIEEKVLASSTNLADEIWEIYAVDLYRRGLLDRFELAKCLKLDRFQVEACLKRHKVFEGSLTMEDLEEDYRTLQRIFNTNET